MLCKNFILTVTIILCTLLIELKWTIVALFCLTDINLNLPRLTVFICVVFGVRISTSRSVFMVIDDTVRRRSCL